MKKKVFLFIILLLSFCIKIDGVKALTCEYEMYPPSYYMKDSTAKTIRMQKNPTMKVKVVYESGTNAQVTVSSSFAEKFEKSFYTSGIATSMVEGSCPLYIKVSTTGNAQTYKDVYAFDKAVDKLLSKNKKATKKNNNFDVANHVSGWIPVALVKQDGKVNSDAATHLAIYIISRQNSIINSSKIPSTCPASSIDISTYGITSFDTFLGYVNGEFKDRNKIDNGMTESCWKARAKYVNAINNANMTRISMESADGDVLERLKKAGQWSEFEKSVLIVTNGSKYFETKKEKEKKENEQAAATADYCYYYCSKSHCTASTDSNYVSACTNGCLANQKPICDKIYEECTNNIPVASAQTECIRAKLAENGLEADYVETRTDVVNALNNEIDQLEIKLTNLEKANKPSLNIDFNYEGYKVKCEDVKFLHIFWVIIRIIVPILVIIFGTVDFFMAVIASDEKKMQTAKKKFPRRLIAAILLFVSTSLIGIFVGISTDKNASDDSLIQCIIEG